MGLFQADIFALSAGMRWLSGSADPSAGGGVTAPVSSFYTRTSTGELWLKVGAGDTNWRNISAPGSALANEVQMAGCNAPSSVYPTSGLIMTPFPAAGVGSPLVDTVVTFQFTSAYAGVVQLAFEYAMSSANSGTVGASLTVFQCAAGANPNGSPTVYSGLSYTPGNDTNVKLLDSTVLANLAITVAAGQTTYLAFKRPIAAPGTHPGDWNLISWDISPVTA